MKSSLRILAALALLLLAACAPQQLVRNQGDAVSLAQQDAREKQLADADHWTLQGHLFVSNGQDGGSGNLTWTQNGDRYEFTLRAPITGKSFRLTGGPDGAVLDGLDGGPQSGPDAEALMRRVLNWDVPLSELRAWVLGLRAQGAESQLSFGDNRLPSSLLQDGWNVTYPAWDSTRQPPLPTKVFAKKPPFTVKLAIESWTMQ
ncbi:lipoprotein insertase outer membrane protein LolB [Dyella psychrodurans]|uniref:Outer-membrane lipoprotein LolB n=1 Tax=Dyella psychrodurans TaxID=1927960 RepID=A0A370X2D3_9GAMM|nr:lipoprotein insertase outer membrane protein LolB [Dyella psychrodurans]RDS82365.1 outer membrane lipoprotein LolB [Dyella psychrodurans]